MNAEIEPKEEIELDTDERALRLMERTSRALEEANTINQALWAYIRDRDAKLEELHNAILVRDMIGLIGATEHTFDFALDAYLDVIGATEKHKERVVKWRAWVEANKERIQKTHDEMNALKSAHRRARWLAEDVEAAKMQKAIEEGPPKTEKP